MAADSKLMARALERFRTDRERRAEDRRRLTAEIFQKVPRVEEITQEVEALAGGAGSSRGTGGMVTKLAAGRIALEAGADMYIVSGRDPNILYDLMEGKAVGTHFIAKKG